MRPEGGTAHGHACRSPLGRAAALESSPLWSRRAGGELPPMQGSAWRGRLVVQSSVGAELGKLQPTLDGNLWEGPHGISLYWQWLKTRWAQTDFTGEKKNNKIRKRQMGSTCKCSSNLPKWLIIWRLFSTVTCILHVLDAQHGISKWLRYWSFQYRKKTKHFLTIDGKLLYLELSAHQVRFQTLTKSGASADSLDARGAWKKEWLIGVLNITNDMKCNNSKCWILQSWMYVCIGWGINSRSTALQRRIWGSG